MDIINIRFQILNNNKQTHNLIYKQTLYIHFLKMNPNKLSHYEESEEADKQNHLDQLKLKVTLSNLQLLELTSKDQKFITTLQSYNKAGVENLTSGNYEQALIYLQQAQKILQYSASCGKTIDRFLIIVTLQNQAAAYQKLWELEKSSDYMEAILYNMNSYLQTSSPVQMTHEIRNQNSESHKLFNIFISKRMDSVIYNLQYSAVSSQIGKHDIALRSAKKSLQIMSIILTELYSYECFIKNKINKSSVLKILRDNCRGFKSMKLDVSVSNIKQKLKKLRSTSYDSEIENKYKNFSIGDVMQIEPIEFTTKVKEINYQIQKIQIIKKVLYVSISYYAMATQLRLLAASCSLNDEKTIKKQTKKSKFYHMNAINIALDHVPCMTQYLQYIIKSFKNNYQIDLDESSQDDLQQSDEDLFFSHIEEESFQIKQQESYRLQDNIPVQKVQTDPLYPESKNSSIEKKRNSSGRESFTDNKAKSTKLKKLYKLQSSSSLKLMEYKSKTYRQESKKKDEKKPKQHSRSRKSLSHVKSSKVLKNPLKRGDKKKSSANSTQKTKDQTKKHEEKRKSQTKKITEEYMTAKKDKTKEKEKKKKQKLNGEESRKKIIRIKSPHLKTAKSPFSKN